MCFVRCWNPLELAKRETNCYRILIYGLCSMLIILVSDVRILNRVHMLYIKHKHKAVVKWGTLLWRWVVSSYLPHIQNWYPMLHKISHRNGLRLRLCLVTDCKVSIVDSLVKMLKIGLQYTQAIPVTTCFPGPSCHNEEGGGHFGETQYIIVPASSNKHGWSCSYQWWHWEKVGLVFGKI